MSTQGKTLFADILAESKDGEWGKGEVEFGLEQVLIIRGTDFKKLSNPNADFPQRWVKSDLIKRKRLIVGDLILETAGGTSNESTGRSALLKKSFFENHPDMPVLCASFSRFLRLKTKEYHPTFIYYLLQSLHKSGYMAVFNIQHTGVSRFQFTSFKNKTHLDIPGFSIQQKIAAILSAYDDLIENNNKRIALLEKAAEEIYREWFVRMRFPGWDKVKFVKGVPEGWNRTPISKISSEIKGNTKIKNLDPGTKYLGLEHLPRKSIAITSHDIVASVQSDKLLFKERDILFGKIRPYLHKVVLAHFSGACSSDTIVIRPKEKKFEGFLLLTVFSETFIELATVASTGTKMPRADWDFLKRLEMLLPPELLLESFQSQFETQFDAICKYLQQNELLKQSRDLFLSRLISGKLSVEGLDIRFPPNMQADAPKG